MRKILVWLKKSHWIDRAAVITVTAVVVACLIGDNHAKKMKQLNTGVAPIHTSNRDSAKTAGVTITTIMTQVKAKLAEFAEQDLKSFIKQETGLDVKEAKIDKVGGLVSISYLNDLASDCDVAICSIADYSYKVIPACFNKLAGTKSVTIIELLPARDWADAGDSGGNAPCISITITENDMDKIDWHSVGSGDKIGLIAKASDLYIHPSMRTNITDAEITKALINRNTSANSN